MMDIHQVDYDHIIQLTCIIFVKKLLTSMMNGISHDIRITKYINCEYYFVFNHKIHYGHISNI